VVKLVGIEKVLVRRLILLAPRRLLL